MKDFAKSIHVGNSDIRSEYNAEIHRLEKKMEQLRSMGQGKQATDVEKQIEKLQKELRELGNSKVGNEKAISSTFHMNNYGIEIGQWSWDWKNGAPEKAKQEEIERKIKAYVSQINKDVKSGDSDERDEVFSKLDKFVRAQGLNKKVGNANVAPVSKPNALIKDPKKDDKEKDKDKKPSDPKDKEGYTFKERVKQVTGNSTEKLFHSLKKDVEEKEEDNDEEIEEVGNANYRYKGYLITKSDEDGEIIVFKPNGRDVAFRGTKSEGMAKDWIDHHSVGNSKTGNAGYPMLKSKVEELSKEGKSYEEVVKELLKFGFTRADIAQYEGYIREHIGNKKVGNSTYDMTERDYENEYKSLVQKRNNSQKGTKEYEEIQKRLDEIRKKIGRSPFGNSASDDKFAYVMREFDEGKLKTPDGKVVTDPAQAKAIAYSESKKTENGCARARNAMKCGNWNSARSIKPVGQYKDFIRDLKNAIMLEVAAITYNGVDEQTLKSWVEQAKKEGYASVIKSVQGKKVILDTY